VVRALLEHVNEQRWYDYCEVVMMTPLHYACKSGSEETVSVLLKHIDARKALTQIGSVKADADQTEGPRGMSCIHYAYQANAPGIVSMLLREELTQLGEVCPQEPPLEKKSECKEQELKSLSNQVKQGEEKLAKYESRIDELGVGMKQKDDLISMLKERLKKALQKQDDVTATEHKAELSALENKCQILESERQRLLKSLSFNLERCSRSPSHPASPINDNELSSSPTSSLIDRKDSTITEDTEEAGDGNSSLDARNDNDSVSEQGFTINHRSEEDRVKRTRPFSAVMRRPDDRDIQAHRAHLERADGFVDSVFQGRGHRPVRPQSAAVLRRVPPGEHRSGLLVQRASMSIKIDRPSLPGPLHNMTPPHNFQRSQRPPMVHHLGLTDHEAAMHVASIAELSQTGKLPTQHRMTIGSGFNLEISPHARAYRRGSPYSHAAASVAEGLNCTYFKRADGTFGTGP